MNLRRRNRHRLFTIEDANRALPLVRAIVRDLMPLWREVRDRQSRLEELTKHHQLAVRDEVSDELTQAQEQLEADAERLTVYINELRDLGAEPMGPEGLVDFPAKVNGRLVHLCWKFDEPEVRFWRELSDPTFERRNLVRALGGDQISA